MFVVSVDQPSTLVKNISIAGVCGTGHGLHINRVKRVQTYDTRLWFFTSVCFSGNCTIALVMVLRTRELNKKGISYDNSN
jgi:hypothetical protein